jgi:hypothetical protein
MNYSQWPDQSRGYGSANGNLIPWETDTNRDAGYPVWEMKRGPISPSTIGEGISNYPTPNALGIIEEDPPTFRGTTHHRSCGYTFSSWLPEFLGCILGMLALTGQTRAPLRILAS